MAQALLGGAPDGVLSEIAPGRIPAAEALEVHRNTVVGGLVNALRLTFPTVEWLVGREFFEQAGGLYARRFPPAQAQLTGYGQFFPTFLGAYEPAAGLAYLGDVARFDLAIDAVGGLSVDPGWLAIDLGAGATLQLNASLRVLRLDHQADRIRDARGGDDESLTALDLSPGVFAYGLWRGPDGVLARALSPGPAAFLQSVIAGADADAGLKALLDAADEAGLADLQTEVFNAPFARLHAETREPLQ
jgi:hypothetical protein